LLPNILKDHTALFSLLLLARFFVTSARNHATTRLKNVEYRFLK
jgi:hypothetical protein